MTSSVTSTFIYPWSQLSSLKHRFYTLLSTFFLTFLIASPQPRVCARARVHLGAQRGQEGVSFLGTGVTGGCEPIVLYKYSKQRKLLSHVLSPRGSFLRRLAEAGPKEELAYLTSSELTGGQSWYLSSVCAQRVTKVNLGQLKQLVVANT